MIEPMGPQPDFSVILPFRDPLPEFRDCLEAIVQEVVEYGSAEIIAVDNDSQDASVALAGSHSSIRLISAPSKSIAGVRNVGARAARGTYLYFLDADCVVPTGQLARARDIFRDTGCTATGCKVGLPTNPSWVERSWVEMHQPISDSAASYINSGNLFVKSSAFRDICGFDETLVSGEDAELGLRLRKKGHTIFQSTTLSVSHLRNPRSLLAFLRKEIWHGLGMFGTAIGPFLDRPTLMLLVHLVLVACSLALLVGSNLPLAWRLILVLAGNAAVPLASVGYRYHQNRMGGEPLTRVALYWVYYLARAIALSRILLSRTTAARS